MKICDECKGDGHCERFGLDLIPRIGYLCQRDEGGYRQWLERGGRPGKKNPKKNHKAKPGWGDQLESVLKSVGITEDRVSRLLGRPCGCTKRKEMLNRLGEWTKKVLTGEAGEAEFKQLEEDHE
jgi:hypothetical protein